MHGVSRGVFMGFGFQALNMNGKDLVRGANTFGQEFLDFVKKYQVLGLAVGIVIGTATQKLVSQIVDGLINPLIGLAIGKETLSNFMFYAWGTPLKVGSVVSALIDFLIIALIVFLVVKKFLRMEKEGA
ncbi:MAG: MscL family protein [Candidatus Diapherotrites archaeon]|nr:MscL family protein [Candidatus Diapherotrites archaeon]